MRAAFTGAREVIREWHLGRNQACRMCRVEWLRLRPRADSPGARQEVARARFACQMVTSEFRTFESTGERESAFS